MSLPQYKHLGNFSAVDPAYSVYMTCDDCQVAWEGCWDNFECPQCGKGELPWLNEVDSILKERNK